jgi:CubicO group peptidase (beta-lactamase class C family)
MSEDTWFDLASLTKPLVTTTLSLLSFRCARFGLGTRVGEVLDELDGSAIAGLTVQHLLTHTSGLPAWLPLYCLAEGSAGDLPIRLGEVQLESPPGSRVVYSCVGFVILGLILERAWTQDLETLFSREVLAVLDLEGELGFSPDTATGRLAGTTDRAVAEEKLVRETNFDPRWIPATGIGLPDDGNARFLGGPAGNSGLFGTARGVLSLASEYLVGGGELLTDEDVRLATKNHTPELEQARGLGWQLAGTSGCSAGPALPDEAFGHVGFTGVSVWLDPLSGRAGGLFLNRLHPGHREADLHPLRRRFNALALLG